MSEVQQVEGPMPHEPAPPVEVKPREERGYVVLLRSEVGDDVLPGEPEVAAWVELGTVAAFNRAGALEQAETRWPEALTGKPQLHLIPERFWQEITPEEQPPPPPRRKWKGV